MTERSILQRLLAVMAEPETAYIQKEQKKKVAGQYTAVSHDAVTRKLRPLFVKHGIIVVPSLASGAMLDTGKKTSKGNPIFRYEAEFDIRFFNTDDAVDHIVIRLPAHAEDEGDKAPGKAISYAQKYAMLKALQIESGDAEEDRVDDAPVDETETVGAMAADEKAALLKQLAEAADKESLTTIFKSAMAAAKEANDVVAVQAFRDASITRAEKLDAGTTEPAPAEAPPKGPVASAAILKTLRKAASTKGVDDASVVEAIKDAGKGDFATLDGITTEAAVWVMNEYLKKLEPARA